MDWSLDHAAIRWFHYSKAQERKPGTSCAHYLGPAFAGEDMESLQTTGWSPLLFHDEILEYENSSQCPRPPAASNNTADSSHPQLPTSWSGCTIKQWTTMDIDSQILTVHRRMFSFCNCTQ